MSSREILRHLVIQQKNQIEKGGDYIERSILPEVLDAFSDNRVLILTGIRRCGKSTLLKQIMQTKTRYCYINFEDERLLDFRAEDFETLNEVLFEVYGMPDIYFFDEIQNIDRFETFVRRLQDQGKKVVITGSNATLLSQEFGTRLTGRYKLFEVYPFSFAEFLRFNRIGTGRDSPYLIEERVRLISAFETYTQTGGMPEYLKNSDPDYIRTLYDNILYRDIIARYSIRRQRLVRELVSMLASSISLPFTYNSLKKTLGLKNAITVKEYISYLSGAYLFFELSKFDYSVKKQLNSPRKIYMIDNAFGILNGFSCSPNTGRLLENIVFVELLRRESKVYYYSGDHECDFIIRCGRKITRAIQVCHELNNDNEDREIGGLLEAMDSFGLLEGIILTSHQEETRKLGDSTITLQPVWKWLIEESTGYTITLGHAEKDKEKTPDRSRTGTADQLL
ncbi:ATP-binding protein [Methanoregula sp.]|jgi:predicted AAA+ superfamily ATPase|uniref:ATP-binding protein n=1 Tax=Methanoregula sp. TaxID=2052170 RepID=UPI0025F97E6A|nr:ATP-binding protein [Methanoregula sp.]